jgi:hypothetical protein
MIAITIFNLQGTKRRPPTLAERSRATTLANDVDIVYQLLKKTLR